ncbi:MAG: YciI family protein [Acidobacteriota bacterium]|nr:YciI family protein [Acidobacteriota bacterium]
MRYVLLIHGDEAAQEAVTPEQGAEMMKAYDAFMAEVGTSGVLQGGERLRPSADSTTVRVRDGQLTTSDGPFAETKEQIGGYFVVDCANLDEAIGVAAKIPAVHVGGTIEVRPIWEM